MTGIFNCHVKGLHSIVLKTYSDGRPWLRMYFTTADHELWKNTVNAFDKLTIGFHPHRADFKITLIHGELCNINACVSDFYRNNCLIGEYLYQSKIKDNKASLTKINNVALKIEDIRWLSLNESIKLPAKQLHTVSVPFQVISAWIIEEAPNTDPNYSSKLYTNNETFETNDLYQEMDEAQISHWISIFNKQIINFLANEIAAYV